MTTREYETEVRHMTPPITADDHAAAVDVAEQRMFEECVKASCHFCAEGDVPKIGSRLDIFTGDQYFIYEHTGDWRCGATNIRMAHKERSARLSSPRAVGE